MTENEPMHKPGRFPITPEMLAEADRTLKELEPWTEKDSICRMEVPTVLGILELHVVPRTRQIMLKKWKDESGSSGSPTLTYYDEEGNERRGGRLTRTQYKKEKTDG